VSESSPFRVEGDGWHVRLADPADIALNRQLCELFASVRLESALSLTQERDPDFFALPRLHQGPFSTAVAFADDGRLVGCGTVAVRESHLGDHRLTSGYLCDLRVAPGFRGGFHLARAYGHFMNHIEMIHGADLFTTVIFDSNTAAVKALTTRSDKRKDQPVYRPMTPFEMVSIQFTRKKTEPSNRVRAATANDHEPLVAFLAARASHRILGEVLTRDRFVQRLALWPNFALEDFLLATDSHDKIVGCLAPWDTSIFKRTRVLGYRGGMLWQKRAFNLAATVMRFPPLPQPGDHFRFAFLTHMEVEDDDPTILRDLLLAAYTKLRPENLHFMSAFVPRGSALASAFQGFMTTKTRMTLYAVHRPVSRWADTHLTTLHPGFEMALS